MIPSVGSAAAADEVLVAKRELEDTEVLWVDITELEDVVEGDVVELEGGSDGTVELDELFVVAIEVPDVVEAVVVVQGGRLTELL